MVLFFLFPVKITYLQLYNMYCTELFVYLFWINRYRFLSPKFELVVNVDIFTLCVIYMYCIVCILWSHNILYFYFFYLNYLHVKGLMFKLFIPIRLPTWSGSCFEEGVNAKVFYLLLNSKALRTISHLSLEFHIFIE